MRKMLCLLIILMALFALMAPFAGCKSPDTEESKTIESFAENSQQNFIDSYEDRYVAYAQKHKKLSYASVLIAVNLGLDQPNYKDVHVLENTQSITALVNKHYALPKQFRPTQLVAVDRKYAQSGVKLREDCYAAFLLMARDMEKEKLTLYIKSGYRTNRKRGDENSRWYAWPGHSEHQTGLAFDLRKKNVSHEKLSAYDFEKTKEYDWLCNNAYRYGFILSFPENKTDITNFGFEPWHWRYVGVDTATDMKEKEFRTFQEYWATYLIRKEIQ